MRLFYQDDLPLQYGRRGRYCGAHPADGQSSPPAGKGNFDFVISDQSRAVTKSTPPTRTPLKPDSALGLRQGQRGAGHPITDTAGAEARRADFGICARGGDSRTALIAVGL